MGPGLKICIIRNGTKTIKEVLKGLFKIPTYMCLVAHIIGTLQSNSACFYAKIARLRR